MGMSTVQVRMDSDIKKDVDQLLRSMGMTMSTAVNIFARQILVHRKLPFEVCADTSEMETNYTFGELRGHCGGT